MSEKRNDDKGYERGAKGIDGKEGEGYENKGRSKEAEIRMYARGWSKYQHTGKGKD